LQSALSWTNSHLHEFDAFSKDLLTYLYAEQQLS
jgi:hypothetical protein